MMQGQIRQLINSRGKWPLIMAVILSSIFLAPLSFLSRIYQPSLIVCLLAYCSMLRNAKLGWGELFLILACATSIVLGNPPAVFNSWLRLGLFCIVLIVTSPIVSSASINRFRVYLFSWISKICVFVGVGSFFAYFLGVNYMQVYSVGQSITLSGLFGGLTPHSMLLGPISAFGLLRCLFLLFERHKADVMAVYYLYFGAFTCFVAVLFSASRSAAGAALVASCYLIYAKLKHQIGKIFKILLCLLCLSVPLGPMIMDFSSGLLDKQNANIESGSMFSSRESLWNARMNEFLESPFYGVGFAALRIMNDKSTSISGQIEPGTSYGAVLSMTGIFGGIIFFYIIMAAFRRKRGEQISMPQIYLVFFLLHLFVEGYIFAGGSSLCFIFWLCIGSTFAIKQTHELSKLTL